MSEQSTIPTCTRASITRWLCDPSKVMLEIHTNPTPSISSQSSYRNHVERTSSQGSMCLYPNGIRLKRTLQPPTAAPFSVEVVGPKLALTISLSPCLSFLTFILLIHAFFMFMEIWLVGTSRKLLRPFLSLYYCWQSYGRC